MSFKKIADRTAKKLKGRGMLRYLVFEDRNHAKYIQIVRNDRKGTFSRLAFSADRYGSMRMQRAALKNVQGVDMQTGETENVADNNVGGFLKAVLRDLLDNPDPSLPS